MEKSVRVPLVKSNQSIVAALAAIGVTVWLFYIDEGYYDFRWMTNDLRNWLWFLVYVAGIWGFQLLAGRFLFRKYAEWEKMVLNLVLGVPIAVALIIGLFMGLSRVILWVAS